MTALDKILLTIIIFVVVCFILGLLRLFLRKEENQYPFIPRYLLSDTEYAFYEVLCRCVPEGCMLFAKVRLWDVIDVEQVENRRTYTNQIRAKHLDFLLTFEDSYPALAIELDDRSHQRADRIARDVFVDNALSAAGIRILHVKTQKSYNVHQLSAQIQTAMEGLPVSEEGYTAN